MFDLRSKEMKRAAIVWCVEHAPNGLSLSEVSDIAGTGMSFTFDTLWRFESAGHFTTKFVDGPYPRKLLYFKRQ